MKKINRILLLGTLLLLLGFAQSITAQKTFVHPGIPFTQSDLNNLKVNITKEPWLSAYNAFKNDSKSKLSYVMKGPFANVTRAPDLNNGSWMNDMAAIHNLTFMYVFTEDEAYAAKATQMLDAWAVTNTTWGGGENMLDIGDAAPSFIAAADILKSTYPGWTADNTAHVNNYFANVLYPTSWVPNPLRDCNKGALQLQIALGIAAFLDDEVKWDQAIETYRMDAGGGLRNSIPSGAVGDTGRDGHWFTQAAALAWGAEVAFKQGVDMFAEMDNRLLAIGELFNHYAIDPTGLVYTPYGGYSVYWSGGWGMPTGTRRQDKFNNIIQAAYSLRKGIPTPWTDQMRSLVGEGAGSFLYLKSADNSTATPMPPIVYPSETAVPTNYFSNTDIGNTGIKGSVSSNAGVWTMKGAGYAAAYSTNFTFKPIKGDAAIVAKMENNSYSGGVSGLMIRESLSPTSKYVSINFTFHSTYAAINATGLGATASNSNYTHYPQTSSGSWWLKLERVGNRVFAYHSHDGVSWTNVALFIIPLTTDAYIGLYTDSNSNTVLNTATFSNVAVNANFPVGSPEMNSATSITTIVGSAFNFNVTATGSPTTYAATGLPAGLSIDTTTGIVSGTPTTAGKSVVLLEATNTSGTGKSALVIDVLSNQSPIAINNLSASSGYGSIKLTWTATANATSYSLKHSLTPGGPYTNIQTNITGTTFTDPKPAYEVKNYYVVTAFVGENESAVSNEVSGSVAPAIPTNLAAVSNSGQVNLTWDTAEGAATYKIKRATISGGPYTEIASASTNAYADNNVTNGNPYYYVITSMGATLESGISSEVLGNPGATSLTWSNTPTTAVFNEATNWIENTVPTSPAVLTFKNTETSLINNDMTGLVAARIQFSDDAANYTITGNSISLKNDLINNSTQNQVINLPIVLDGQLNVNAKNNSIELNGILSGTGSLLKTGTSALVMTGANTYSGNTVIRGTTGYHWGSTEGIQVLGIGEGTSGHPISGPLGTGKIILEGGALYTGLNPEWATLYNDIEVAQWNSGYFYERQGYLNLYGRLLGSGTFYNDGSDNYATLSLYGNNSSFTGTFVTKFRSASHRLAFMTPESGSANAKWFLDASGADCHRIMYSSGVLELGSLEGRGGIRCVVAGTPTIRIGALNTDTTFLGTIANASGTLSIEKVGTGALTFTGNCTFTGTTTISKGKFLLSNNGSTGIYNSPIIVEEGTLGGSGISTGTITVNAGAVLTPGNDGTIGTLTSTGLVKLNADAIYKIDVNSSTIICDKLKAGSVSLNQAKLILNNIGSGELPSETTFTIIDNTGTDAVTGTFKDLPEKALVSLGGHNFRITYKGGTGNDVQLLDESLSGMYYIKIAGTNSFLTKNTTSNTLTFGSLTADKNLQRWKISVEVNGKYKISSNGDAPTGYKNYINENAKFGTEAYDMTLNTMNIYSNGTQFAIQGSGNGYWYTDGNILLTEPETTNSSTPLSFPFELVLDINNLLDVKLDEAKAIRDAAQTSTTQEAGKYPVEAKQNFSDAIDLTLARYDSLTTVDQINAEIIFLNTAISDFKKTAYYNTNQLADGSYYIKIPNSGLYWTKNGTNAPTFETVNSDKSIQHWNVTKQSNGLYKITCLSSPSSFQNYINENAQFGVNTYDAAWNTMNIFFDGTTYAIQRTQKSGNGYWYVSGNKILTQLGTTYSSVPSSFPLELVLDFKYGLDAKIDEAKIVRDELQNQTTTTQEAGKYPLTKWESLVSAINTAVSRYNTITSAAEANIEVSNLDLAIISLKQSMYYDTNQLANGNYYIKIPDTESYWTKNTTNVPVFAGLNTDRSIQIWNITKQSNGRYKISHVSAPSTSYQNYINENAQFGKNGYDAAWNTINVYFNGTTYAIQKAEKSGFGYWYVTQTNILATSTTTSSPPASFPISLVPVDGLQIITFNTLSNKTMGDADFEGGAITTSGLAVSYTSSNPAVATIVNGKIHIVGSGTTNIKASQAGNEIYSPATTVTQALTVLKNSQIITFNPLADKTMGDADFDAAATASSGLSVSYSSSNAAVATIVDGKVHIVGAGTANITASQEGNATYLPAMEVTQSLTVLKRNQSITFASISNKILGDADFDAGATVSSNLLVSYTSSNPTVATIVDGKIHLVATGTSIITASQAGNETYDPAADVSQTLTVIATLKVKYKDGDNNLTNNQIKPNLTIYNEGAVAIPYNELTLRYWVTPENYSGISTWIDYAQLGNSKVKMKYVALSEPRNGAFGYIEYGFEPTAGNLLAGANSGQIQSRFANSNWSNLSESDDYSYTNASAYAYNEHITMYRNGQLVWGVEPDVTPAIVNLKVYTETKSGATANSISTYLKISNEGNVPVDYGDVKVRYWFTKEGAPNLNYYLDYSALGNSNIESAFVALNPVHDGANTYLELGLKASLGTFYPSGSTGNIQYRIAKTDWSNFNQTDDYSYNANTIMSLNDKVTVYYQGQLIYGTEPLVTAYSKKSIEKQLNDNTIVNSEENLETVIVYPNPVINTLNIKVSEVYASAKLELYNTLGMKLRSESLTSNLQEMSLEGLPSGTYLLNIINGKKVLVKKVIKK